MTVHHVSVDGARLYKRRKSASSEDIMLFTHGQHQNVTIEREELIGTLGLGDLPEAIEDLVLIATAVYAADARVPRMTDSDVFGSKWRRDFRISVPVLEPELWSSGFVNLHLTRTLNHVTGDSFEFNFSKRRNRLSRQLNLPIGSRPDVEGSDVVVLFSGGLDSLAAAVMAVADKRHPLLVGHRPGNVIHSRQRRVVNALRPSLPQWTFPILGLKINSNRGSEPKEYSQRSRSFLFAALGAAACHAASVNELYLCDNGVVSLNLPQSSQNVGTLLSRSTHPLFLSNAQELLRAVLDLKEFRITNTLLEMTRVDVLQSITNIIEPKIIQETASCAHPQRRTQHQPHCGTCTQCIDRRFSTIAAGMEEHDLAGAYEVDIFTDELKDGTARTHAENYVRFSSKLQSIADAQGFAMAYLSELTDASADESVESFATRMWPVFWRHSNNTEGVLELMLGRQIRDLVKNGMPQASVLRFVATGERLRERGPVELLTQEPAINAIGVDGHLSDVARSAKGQRHQRKSSTNSSNTNKKAERTKKMPAKEIFISYCRKDKDWLDRLNTMVRPMVRQNTISTWDDTQIGVGDQWRKEINLALSQARVAVLLVSAGFLASEFIHNHELPQLLAAASTGGTTIVWVPVAQCMWEESPISVYQAAWPPERPLNSLSEAEIDDALKKIAQSIKAVVQRP
jgi:hypothetical protein